MGLIVWLSSGPGLQIPSTWWNLFSPDKLGHLFFYGVLATLTLRGLHRSGYLPQPEAVKPRVWIAIGVSALGMLMEFNQWAFFPGRYFEMADELANIAGAILGVLPVSTWKKYKII